MKIYTYYQPIDRFLYQDQLIALWQKSWKKQGFEPIVLSLEDAQKHSFYQTYIQELKNLHLQIQKQQLTEYGLSCYNRWLAYATQEKEPFLVSDYDVINLNLKPESITIIDQIHFMDRWCPCLVSGTPEQFQEFCKDIISLTKSNISKLQTINMHWYHDQEFVLNFKDVLTNKYIIDRCPILWQKVKHYSHNDVQKIKNITNIDELRIKLIKNAMQILNGVL